MQKRIANSLDEFIKNKNVVEKANNHIPFDEDYIVSHTDLKLKDYIINTKGEKAWNEIIKAKPVNIYDGFFRLSIYVKKQIKRLTTKEFSDGTYEIEIKK